MEQLNSILAQKTKPDSALIKSSSWGVYFTEDNPYRRWEIAFDYKTKMYLTDEEHTKFLDELSKGRSVVQIGDMTLSNKFLYMIPIKDKPNPRKVEAVKNEKGTIIGYKEI